MQGTEVQNDAYCNKSNSLSSFQSFGEFIIQGQRTDLEKIKFYLDQKKKMHWISVAFFANYLRYFRGMEKYRELVAKKDSTEFRQVEVIIHSGSTGTGKTRLAMEQAEFMIQGDGLQWWDGYEGEEVICIDEYSNQVNITKLLSLLDGYQLRLPIKGGFTYANWTKVYITTNLPHLHEKAREEHIHALNRRVTKWINFYPDGSRSD